MRRYRPVPGVGRPITRRSRGARRSVEPIDRSQVEIKRAAVHHSQQRLRRRTTIATSLDLCFRAPDGEPPHERGVRLVRTCRSTHTLERAAKLGVGCYGNTRMLTRHARRSVAP